MRHSYINRPRRIRAPRATTRAHTRFLPAVAALPVVGVLWVTVGLPVLSQVTGAGSSKRLARDVVFAAQVGRGGGAGGNSGLPQVEAATTVSSKVIAEYHAEVAKRARARSSAATKAKAKRGNFALPQLRLPGPTHDTATLATDGQITATSINLV